VKVPASAIATNALNCLISILLRLREVRTSITLGYRNNKIF
jgi:hypothetical protein